jgi:hypothetical protein
MQEIEVLLMYCRSELKSKHMAVFFSGPPRFTDTRFTDNTKSVWIRIWGPAPNTKSVGILIWDPTPNTKSVGMHIWGLGPLQKSVGIHIWDPAPNKKSVWIHIWGKIYVYCDDNYGVRV